MKVFKKGIAAIMSALILSTAFTGVPSMSVNAAVVDDENSVGKLYLSGVTYRIIDEKTVEVTGCQAGVTNLVIPSKIRLTLLLSEPDFFVFCKLQ